MIVLRNEETEQYFRDVEAFAKKTEQLEQFRQQLWILHTYGECSHPRFLEQKHLDPIECHGTDYSRATLYRDFAPYSFNVSLERRIEPKKTDGEGDHYRPWMAMGLLYHGPHDGHGSGSAPTFAVTATPTQGWSIHS